MSFSHSFRNWLVLGPLVVSSFTLLHCSSKDDDVAETSNGGNAGSSAGKGGSASVAGASSAGKAGSTAASGGSAGTTSGGTTSAGSAGATSAGSGGGQVAPECEEEADCGAGQICMTGKCVVKPCEPPPTAFQFKPASAATTVSLAGSLNAWSTTASPLALDAGSGYWKGSFNLAAGTYQYKFVVDGTTWLPDPANTDTVDDGFCGFNSQLTIGCEGVEPAQGVHGSGCPPEGGAGGESSGGAAATGGAGAGG